MKEEFQREVDNQKELKENQIMKGKEVEKELKDLNQKLNQKEGLEKEHWNKRQ